MWQCVPVKKIVARVSTALVVAAYIQPLAQGPAQAQANIGYNRVVSSKVSKTNGSVTLFTDNRRQLPRPIIRFLPGEYGDTILVADFPGVIWQPSTEVIQVNSSFANRFATTLGVKKRGIKLVRIGRFQDSPPVMRIAVISNDPQKLKSISFNSKPGKLTVSWSKWLKTQKSPATAPSYKQKHNIKEIATAPPYAPPIGSLDPQTISKADKLALRPPIGMKAQPAESLEQKPKKRGLISSFLKKMKSKYSKSGVPEVAPQNESKFKPATPQEIIKDKQEKAKNQDKQEEAPIITLTKTGEEAYRVIVRSQEAKALAYKSFKLSNPDRFVVDFENLKEISKSTVPAIDQNQYVTGLRVGNPLTANNANTGRLVFDLKNPHVEVVADKQNGGNSIAFVVGQTKDILSGLKAPVGATVILDAGHGGDDPGAQRGHLNEKDITLSIVNKTYAHLRKKGVKCILTRDKDSSVSLQDRVKVTNSKRPDLFLSVHVNSLETKSDIHGIETYYQTPQSLTLAKIIHNSLVEGLEAPDRRVRKARFYVVNRTSVPAVLAEVGFISHKEERKKLGSDSYQNDIALALAKGVIQHLNQTTTIAKRKKEAKNLSNNSVTSRSKVAKTQGQIESKRGTISRVSRLAQKGLGITVK